MSCPPDPKGSVFGKGIQRHHQGGCRRPVQSESGLFGLLHGRGYPAEPGWAGMSWSRSCFWWCSIQGVKLTYKTACLLIVARLCFCMFLWILASLEGEPITFLHCKSVLLEQDDHQVIARMLLGMGTALVREVVGDICCQLPVIGIWTICILHISSDFHIDMTFWYILEIGGWCTRASGFLCVVTGASAKKSGARLESFVSISCNDSREILREYWGCILEHTFADTLWMQDGMCSILPLGQHWHAFLQDKAKGECDPGTRVCARHENSPCQKAVCGRTALGCVEANWKMR